MYKRLVLWRSTDSRKLFTGLHKTLEDKDWRHRLSRICKAEVVRVLFFVERCSWHSWGWPGQPGLQRLIFKANWGPGIKAWLDFSNQNERNYKVEMNAKSFSCWCGGARWTEMLLSGYEKLPFLLLKHAIFYCCILPPSTATAGPSVPSQKL
jgi:hypothetical protein